MDAQIKPIIEEMLQLAFEGKLVDVTDMFAVIDRHWTDPNGIPFAAMQSITTLAEQVIRCDNIPAATAFAAEHNLTLRM